MKSHFSFQSARRALLVTSLSLAVGTGVALAQTSGTGNSSSGSRSGSSSSDSNYNSGTSTSRNHDATMANSSTGSASSNSSGKLSFGDKRFVTKAADDGQAEVQIGQLAASQASNPEVKAFAQKMVNDHTAVNEELMSLASSKGVTLDKDDGKDRAYKRLAKKSGTDFDREFVEHMVDDHEKAVKMFEKEANDAKDPEIRAFASKHLEHLREHLAQAQSLRASVMPTGREDSNSGRGNANNSSTSSTGSSGNSNSNSSGSYGSSTGASGTSGSTSTSTSGDSTRRGSK